MGKINHRFEISMIEVINSSVVQLVEHRKELLLSIMPKGTEFFGSSEALNGLGMTMQCILTFEHPYFKDGAEIEVNFTRIAWRDQETDPIKQDAMLSGIRYTGLNCFGSSVTL